MFGHITAMILALSCGFTDPETSREALRTVSAAIEASPKDAKLWFQRGTLYEQQRRHEEAVADFDRAIELDPQMADAYGHRGSEQFTLGRFADSIADFDREIALEPRRKAGHWKRGIAYYYAGRYDEGRKQFEGYQTVDNNDVENAVWRFLCTARNDSVASARADLLIIKKDRRVPMMEIYAMFAGQATPDDVLTAAGASNPAPDELKHRLFYAHLYLGLYHDATGDTARTKKHLRAAVERKIGHYMWDVAKVHADLLAKGGK